MDLPHGAKLRKVENHAKRQIAGNIKKLSICNTTPQQVAFITHLIIQLFPEESAQWRVVCCQGSRQGIEPYLFSQFLRTYSYGTDISPTSAFFPGVFEHDFHKQLTIKPDIIYSNSYDQSNDPNTLFSAWLKSLNHNGLLILRHGNDQNPDTVGDLDPFGITIDGLIELIRSRSSEVGIDTHFYVINDLTSPSIVAEQQERYVICKTGKSHVTPEALNAAVSNSFNWVKQCHGNNDCVYSPLDPGRNNPIPVYANYLSQALIAISLTHPQKAVESILIKMRDFMNHIYSDYTYEKASNANKSEIEVKDYLKLFE